MADITAQIQDTLDKMSPRAVAEEWAYQLNGRNGSRESAFIYQAYVSTQPFNRQQAIVRRFKYLTSDEGALHLVQLIEDRE
jgi:hypothetical protein